MNKEILEEKAQLYALGTMPEDEVGSFEALIREDREARELVYEYQKVVELDAKGVALDPPFSAYSDVMKRIDAESRETVSQGETKPGVLVPFLSWSGWAAAACLALLFGLGVLTPSAEESESDIVINDLGNSRFVAVKTPGEEENFDDAMMELAGLAEAYWFSREGIPEDQLLENSMEAKRGDFSAGFTIFDRRHKIGFIAVENLPREAPNRSYHVWARTGEGSDPVRAGTLPIGDESRGLFFFDLSDLPQDAQMEELSFFVTEEAIDSPSSPSNMIVLSDV